MTMIMIVTGTISIGAVTVNPVGENAPKIKIDEKTFPCEMVRRALKEKVDFNEDGWLSQKEIENLKKLGISTLYYKDLAMGDAICYEKKYGCIDCKGLEIFKNLESIYFQMCAVRGYNTIGKAKHGNKIKSLDVLKKLPKLECLTIDNLYRKNYDFSGFKSLKKLKLINCDYIKNIKFGKKSKIEKLDLSDSSSTKTIDVSGLKKLKSFESEFSLLKGVKFGKNNKKLTNIFIGGELAPDYNKKIKTLDFSKVKNLKKLRIYGLRALKTVKLGKKPKIKKIDIFDCKKLKKINIKGCEFPKNAKIGISYE